MSDNIAKRVCSLIAEIMDAPPANVRPETALKLDDLGWKGLLMIRLEIEHEFRVLIPDGAPDLWITVADVIESTERQQRRAA